jgi:predicted deacylase
VKGVWRVDSGKPGPTLGITIHTHGNEPSGLATLWYLRNKFRLEKRLLRGSVFVVLNNIRATGRYLRATTRKEESATRCVNVNFNRLPADVMTRASDDRYEVRRAQELRPIWEKFDVAMDIHGTSQPSQPMIVNVGKLHRRLIQGFPVRIILDGIVDVQMGKPATAFYGNAARRIQVLGIEAGTHKDSQAFKVAALCARRLLENTGLVASNPRRGTKQGSAKKYTVYPIATSVIFPDDSFQLVKIFKNYERVRKGQLLATGSNNRTIVAPFNGCVLFPKKKRKPVRLDEEVIFLSRPPKTVQA